MATKKKKPAAKKSTAKKPAAKKLQLVEKSNVGYFMLSPSDEASLGDVFEIISHCIGHFKPQIELQMYKATENVVMWGISNLHLYDTQTLWEAFYEHPVTVYDFLNQDDMEMLVLQHEKQILERFSLQPAFNTVWLAMDNLYYRKGWQEGSMTQWGQDTNDILIHNITSQEMHNDLLEAIKEAGFTSKDYTVKREESGWCFTLKKKALQTNIDALANLLENSEAA